MAEIPSGENPKSIKNVFIYLPTGQKVNLDDRLGEQRTNMEARMPASILRKGDLLAITYTAPDNSRGKFLFTVSSSEWGNLGVGNKPHASVQGRLLGDLPEDTLGEEAYFAGSGFGGAMRQGEVIETGCHLYFSFGRRGDFFTPPIDYFEISRPGSTGEMRLVEPNELDAELRGKVTNHQRRLEQSERLIRFLGFDRFDFRNGQIHVPLEDVPFFEDGAYRAQYYAGRGAGNHMTILDKGTRQVMMLKYFNSSQDDFLQIGFADLSGLDLREVFMSDNIVFEDGIHRSGRAMTTYTSSGRYGVDAVNYHVSRKQARKNLKIPTTSGDETTLQPDIQIWPENKIKIAGSYERSKLEETHPSLLPQLESSISALTSHDGVIILNLNGEKVRLKDPDAEIAKKVQHFTNPGSNPRTQSLISKIKSLTSRIPKGKG